MSIDLSNTDFFHGQILVGLLPSLANIAVHSAIVAVLSWTAYRTTHAVHHIWMPIRLAVVMMGAVTILMAAHVIEIVIWAMTYAELKMTPERSDAFYLAFVNYTTLGYGDVLPVKRWRLLGPMAAMNGILLFGWSTAVIYDVLRTVAQAIPLKTHGE